MDGGTKVIRTFNILLRPCACGLAATLFVTNCLLGPLDAAGAKDKEPGKHSFVTKASYYSGKFKGRRTASGDRYNPAQLTAASPDLPLGTQVEVKNPRNGRKCNVVVNDRGPFVKGRKIDLSRAAAKRIGVTGVAPVVCNPNKHEEHPDHSQKAKKKHGLSRFFAALFGSKTN
ncbi:MAG: septal ring lytic transglycosylase RlpA family protein [Cyanobacteria bacterium]|nr:septal ring lytic transglycosylase RlpA family protein [Cyanobacteriota bacterium]